MRCCTPIAVRPGAARPTGRTTRGAAGQAIAEFCVALLGALPLMLAIPEALLVIFGQGDTKGLRTSTPP